MIPSFLKGAAVLIRQLLVQGRAVHVTESDAAELELLAGLPWDECRKQSPETGPVAVDVYWEESVTPADIAYGWLDLAYADVEPGRVANGIRRAAACAELATLASGVFFSDPEPVGSGKPPGIKRIYAHDGSKEGARAAWMFIANHLQPDLRPVIKADYGCVGIRVANPETVELGNKYRRELEAMK